MTPSLHGWKLYWRCSSYDRTRRENIQVADDVELPIDAAHSPPPIVIHFNKPHRYTAVQAWRMYD